MNDPTPRLRLTEAIDSGTLTPAQRVRLASLLDVIAVHAATERPTELQQACYWESVAHWYLRVLDASEEETETRSEKLTRLERELGACTREIERIRAEVVPLQGGA